MNDNDFFNDGFKFVKNTFGIVLAFWGCSVITGIALIATVIYILLNNFG